MNNGFGNNVFSFGIMEAVVDKGQSKVGVQNGSNYIQKCCLKEL